VAKAINLGELERIQTLCNKGKDWSSHRAVSFLDPYGMRVE